MMKNNEVRGNIIINVIYFFIVIFGILFLAGCGQDGTHNKPNTSVEESKNDSNKERDEPVTSHKADTPVPDEMYAVGDVINVGDLIMTINTIEDSTLEEDKPYIKESERGLIIHVTVLNNGLDEFLLSGALFSLFSDDGKDYNTSLLGPTLEAVDGILEPGTEKSGLISFIVPEIATGLMLYYNHFDVLNKDPLHKKVIMIELGQ